MQFLFLIALLGCPTITDSDEAARLDTDDDGVGWPDDCAPDDGSVANESIFYDDGDGDGYGEPGSEHLSCGGGPNLAVEAGDCDDSTDAISPGLGEVCRDGLDNDCSSDAPECRLVGAYLASETAAQSWFGTAYYGGLGTAVVSGDLDDDGIDDLVTSAPGEPTNGNIYLSAGPIGGGTPQTAFDVTWTGVRSHDGSTLAIVDTDGDGMPGVFVSNYSNVLTLVEPVSLTPGSDSLSAVGTPYDPPSAVHNFGFALANVGDVDGDGRENLLVGAPSNPFGPENAARVYIARSPWTGSTLDPLQTMTGPLGDALGWSVSSGDLDGDGQVEIVAGVPLKDSAGIGEVWVWSGALTGDLTNGAVDATIAGRPSASGAPFFGWKVEMSGDLDGDGLTDLVVGSPGGDGTPDGAVYGFDAGFGGSLGYADADFSIVASAGADMELGYALTAVTDLDGDGADELLVVSTHDGTGESGQVASLFYGPLTGALEPDDADATFVTAHPSDGSRNASVWSGDVSGDGLSDLLVGEPYAPSSTDVAGAGALHVWHGEGM